MDFNAARVEVEKTTFKFWHLEEFDEEKKHTDIMSDMPDIQEFEKKKILIQKDLHKVTPELRQFYCEPLLTKIQEFHLFRQMNFLKYRAQQYYKWYSKTKLPRLKNLFITNLQQSHVIRNKIVCCNTRLAAQVYKKRKDFYGDDVDNLLSDCFANIIKAVDGFDFRRGFKFSTYCTWVLMNNSLRDHQSDKKFQEKFATNVADTSLKHKIDESALDEDEKRDKIEKIQGDMTTIFQLLAAKGNRDLEIILEYYGLKDGKKKTLKQISEAMDITKERVRQIRNNAITYLQTLVSSGQINMSSGDYIQ
jgi:RNA polymerase primary sigma factor/RNA polymerase sigma factor